MAWRSRQAVDQRQRFLRAAPVGGPGALVMRDDQRHAGREGGVARLVHCIEDVGHLRAHVGGVHAVVAGDHARQRRDLGRRRRHGLGIEQPRRQADRALGHAALEQRAHRLELLRAGRPRQVVHAGKAQCGVAHQRRHVERRPGQLHRARIRGHRRVLERTAEQRERPERFVDHVGRHRQAAVARDDRGDALRQLGCHLGRIEHDGIVVGVHVDEARRDRQAPAVDHLHLAHRHAGGQLRAQVRPDGQDALAAQQDVAAPGG